MLTIMRPPKAIILVWLVVVLMPSLASGAENTVLWRIGSPDGKNAEFALAPSQYARFREDAVFLVGRSTPQSDWSYVHPGPGDGWAGARSHTFTIVFGLKRASQQGQCRLLMDSLDAHQASPPQLKINVNGQSFDRAMSPGGGDASIFGQPAQGKPARLEVAFPARLLNEGDNTINITTLTGSWFLYDAVTLETPAGFELGLPVGKTLVDSVEAVNALIQRNGKYLQPIQITLRHLDDEKEARLKLDGSTVQVMRLNKGFNQLELTVPAVSMPKTAEVALEVEGATLIKRTVELKPVRRWVIYILPHSHVDIGYTDLQTNIERKQIRNIERGLELARTTAEFPAGARYKWNVEVLWAVDSYLREADTKKRQEFFEAVRKGWIGLDAMYGNELTGLCRPEELMRVFRFSTQLGQQCGVPVESAMISDVPGYTWGVISAMAQAGVKYWSIGPNYFDRMGYTIRQWENRPFYWAGPSGKDQVLCWVPYQGYAISHILQSNLTPEFINQLLAKLEKDAHPYDILHLRWSGHGDNATPDEKIPEFVKDWNAKHAYPQLIISTTAEAFHAFEQRYGKQLPRYSGDWTPYWEDGAGSSARETAINRSSAERLVQAETLWTMLNPGQYPAIEFGAAWRNVLLYSEHTWGAHNSITEPEGAFAKDQWTIKQRFALDGEAQSRQLLAQATSVVDAKSSAGQIEVFNTLSWPRTELVMLSPRMSSSGDRIVDADGKEMPSQRLSSGELAFLAVEVPPFAMKRYANQKGAATVWGSTHTDGATLKNKRLLARVDPVSGAIVDFRANGIQQNLVDAGSGALNNYLYVAGSDVQHPLTNGAVRLIVRDAGPLVASLVVESEAPGCNKLWRELRLVEGFDYLEISNTLDKQRIGVKGKPGDWGNASREAKEGVHFGYAFHVPQGVMRMDIPWAVARPELDQLPGACKNWFTVQRWVDISNPQCGVTWATLDAPMVEVGALTANLLGSQANPEVWINRLEPSQKFYSWVMNNHWHTNYRPYQEGLTTFRYAIRPHRQYDPVAAARFGIAQSQPLIAVPATGRGSAKSCLRVEPVEVLVASLKPGDDGQGAVVRLFGASGTTQQARITWTDKIPREVWLSDLSERKVRRVSGPIEVPAWGVVTLRVEKARKKVANAQRRNKFRAQPVFTDLHGSPQWPRRGKLHAGFMMNLMNLRAKMRWR